MWVRAGQGLATRDWRRTGWDHACWTSYTTWVVAALVPTRIIRALTLLPPGCGSHWSARPLLTFFLKGVGMGGLNGSHSFGVSCQQWWRLQTMRVELELYQVWFFDIRSGQPQALASWRKTVRFKMVSMRSEKSICALFRLSEVSPMLPVERL